VDEHPESRTTAINNASTTIRFGKCSMLMPAASFKFYCK
jgi:hypothetical protein